VLTRCGFDFQSELTRLFSEDCPTIFLEAGHSGWCHCISDFLLFSAATFFDQRRLRTVPLGAEAIYSDITLLIVFAWWLTSRSRKLGLQQGVVA